MGERGRPDESLVVPELGELPAPDFIFTMESTSSPGPDCDWERYSVPPDEDAK